MKEHKNYCNVHDAVSAKGYLRWLFPHKVIRLLKQLAYIKGLTIEICYSIYYCCMVLLPDTVSFG